MINRLEKLLVNTARTRAAFARLVEINPSYLSAVLNGRQPLNDALLMRIVARTGVNEKWLRTGEGEMFEKSKPTEQTPYDLAISAGAGELVAEIFSRYCELSQEQKTAFESVVRALLKAQKNGEPSRGSSVAINNVWGDNNTTIH